MKKWSAITAIVIVGLLNVFLFQNCSSDSASMDGVGDDIQVVSENLFPAGDLDDSNDLAYFRTNNGVPTDPMDPNTLVSDSAHDGTAGLHLEANPFAVYAAQLPTLDINKTYRISFWAKTKRTPSRENAVGNYPFLVIYSGSVGAHPYDTTVSANYIEDARMGFQNSTWTKVESVFKPTFPKLYLEFWVMIGENIVDFDQLKIEEVNILNDVNYNPIANAKTIDADDFENITPFTVNAGPNGRGWINDFEFYLGGNTSSISVGNANGFNLSRGTRLFQDNVRLIYDLSGLIKANKRYKVSFQARAYESAQNNPSASITLFTNSKDGRVDIYTIQERMRISISGLTWVTYEMIIEPRYILNGSILGGTLSINSDKVQAGMSNPNYIDIDNFKLEEIP